MRVYTVQIHVADFDEEQGSHYFKNKSEAITFLKKLKEADEDDYKAYVEFSVIVITVDSDAIFNLLKGWGYADEVIELDKP